MAALDFGMALARGMLPKAEKAQKDLLNLAGGRNVFKSEDWWNKQVDKQIDEGYRTVKEQGREYLMPRGEYQLGKRNVQTRFYRSGPFGTSYLNTSGPFGMSYQPSYHPIFGYSGGWQASTSISYDAPEGAVLKGYNKYTNVPEYTSRAVDIYDTKRTDYTAGELADIEEAARSGAEAAKRQTAETKGSKRRLARATGGLMGKARATGEGPATGLPALGEGGLGVVESILGGGIKL